jgi:hypothetical protein
MSGLPGQWRCLLKTFSRSILIAALILPACLAMGMKDPPRPGRTFAYPSPSSCGFVNFAYFMRENGACRVRVYHEGGGLVSSFQNTRSVGVQESRVNVCPFAPGVYIYRLSIDYSSGNTEKLGGKFIVKH